MGKIVPHSGKGAKTGAFMAMPVAPTLRPFSLVATLTTVRYQPV
jgi:hypothetical protein